MAAPLAPPAQTPLAVGLRRRGATATAAATATATATAAGAAPAAALGALPPTGASPLLPPLFSSRDFRWSGQLRSAEVERA
jgi:hypothetical protein